MKAKKLDKKTLWQSQLAAGLASGGNPPSSPFGGIIHAVDPTLFTLGPDELSRMIVNGERVFGFTGIPQRVIGLLNQSVATLAFQKIVP